MKRFRIFFTMLVVAAFVLTACGPQATATQAPTEAPAATITPTLGPPAGDVSFFSTQFNIVEEAAKFRAILEEGGNYDFTGSEDGPLLALVLAGAETGQGQVDLVGALHAPIHPLRLP